MSFQLIILGSLSAAPGSERLCSAQILDTGKHLFLIDCAEGTQMQLRRFRVRFQKINHIFISHLHGDHFFGLIGLITTFHLLGRDRELHVYGPSGLKEVIEFLLQTTQTHLLYPLHFHLVEGSEPSLVFEDTSISVYSLPLLHRIPTWGYLFREKKGLRKIDKDRITGLNLPVYVMPQLKAGKDVTLDDGTLILSSDYTLDPPKPISYAYCSDTGFFEPLTRQLQQVDHLFHEATFLEKDSTIAHEKQHSTAKEAAIIAKMAGVKKLYLGHFSARYKELDLLLHEAREIFPDTYLAEEGSVFNLD